jgi:topoisomerase-4 subunit A
LVLYNDGYYEIADQELTQRLDAEKVLLIEKFDPTKIITVIYFDAEKMQFNIKRFNIETTTLHSKFLCIKEGEKNYVELVTTEENPTLILHIGKKDQAKTQRIKVADFIEVMGWKAAGNKLVDKKAVDMEWEEIKGKTGKQAELF